MKFEQYCSGKLTIGEAEEKRLSENAVEISISLEAVDGAEFVELTLNERPIPAGSSGWYLVTNGTKCWKAAPVNRAAFLSGKFLPYIYNICFSFLESARRAFPQAHLV